MGKSLRTVTTVESHTEGMPTRVVTSGIEEIPGATMFEKRLYFMEHMDEIRQWLMYEPRGHSAMSGAILQNLPGLMRIGAWSTLKFLVAYQCADTAPSEWPQY